MIARATQETTRRVEVQPKAPGVHLGFRRGHGMMDTRCGTGDRKSITWNLAEATCPLCLYWAKRGNTKHTYWPEISVQDLVIPLDHDQNRTEPGE